MVVFKDASSIPESLRGACQRVVENALDLMRHAGENWWVTLAQTETTLRLDFTLGTDAVRSLTLAVDGDDERHSQMFRLVCGFLWANWPTTKRPSGITSTPNFHLPKFSAD